MKNFLFYFAFLALGASPARAETSYSRLLAHVQNTYLRSAAPYPILIMDRDDLEWRFVQAGATADVEGDRRAVIVQDYVKQKTGILISANAASNFEPYLAQLKDAAVAMPALKDGADQAEVEMCAIFPPDPNRNQRLEMERILQLRTAEAYGTHEFSQLRQTMNYDSSVLFSVLHESGHCMDSTFFPRLFAGDTNPAAIHQSESFAETIAVFLMAKEGYGDVAEARSYLRDMYSYFMEPFFIAHPELGFGSDAFSYGGVIYHLSPSIRAAGAVLASRPGEIQSLPLSDVQKLARDIVEKNAFETRFMSALFSGYSDGRESALTRYRDYEAQMPDLFAGIVARLEGYWLADDEFQVGAFRASAPKETPPTMLLPFDQSRACAALGKGDYDGIRDQIEVLRRDLRQGTPSYAAQSQRFALLSELWKNLPSLCKGVKSINAVKAGGATLYMDALVPKKLER